ncbi:TPA: hypothetical protein L3869_001498 [Pseudomonas aeruginosa]|nr:hypothetical protein [Pseudomonas aeruginosa]
MKDNGGQAFPSESMYTSEAGMTLRDYYAPKTKVFNIIDMEIALQQAGIEVKP